MAGSEPSKRRWWSRKEKYYPRTTGSYSMVSLPTAKAARTVGDGSGSSIVTAPLGWLIRNYTEANLRLREQTPDGLADAPPNHPFTKLVTRPNPYYTGKTLQKALVGSYELDGNAYWLCVLNSMGEPVEAWHAPHHCVTPKRLEDSPNFLDYYEYKPGGFDTLRIAPIGMERIGTEPGLAMLHFRNGIDPTNPLKGMSGFKSIMLEVFTDTEAAAFTSTLLQNMGVPGLVISPRDDSNAMMPSSDEDIQATKHRFKQATTGNNRGEPIVMTGATNITTIGFNPSELDLTALRRISEERVTAVLGVPAIVAGLGAGLDRSTYSNMSEARESAYEEKIIPLQRDIAETMQCYLLPTLERSPENYSVDYDLSNVRILQKDENEIATRVTGLVNGGIISVAEGREDLGYPSDETHAIYLRPMNLIETPVIPEVGVEQPQADRTLEYRLAASVSAGLMTLNEARQQLGLPAVANGNELRTEETPGSAEGKA